MARWEINRFKVKPTGIFAKWRGVIIYTDENGAITYGDWPGEESINQDCLNDYKKNDRGIYQDQKITEYCNTITHTNYRIYAQDCRPWAYTQTDLNAAKCGYLEPLPEPAVPPNPFGSANYGEYKNISACDNKNNPIQLKIFRRNYNGTVGNLDGFTETPIIISWKNSEDNKFTKIIGSEVTINLVSMVDFGLQQFYTEDERQYRVEIYKSGNLKFKGFLTPSDANEQFIAAPYSVTLRAVDGLGALKKIAYPLPVGSSLDISQNFISVIAYCLAMTNLDLNIVTGCNLYAVGMPNTIDDDPLALAFVNPLRLNDGGVVMNCYQALEYICAQFGAFLVQDNGEWKFMRQSELSNTIVRIRRYNYKGFFINSEQYKNKRIAACKGNDITILNDSPYLKIGSAYKRVIVRVNFGEVPAIIYNGDFELWDGQNFNYWTRYGAIDISQIEKTIKSGSTELPTGNHMLRFNKKADSGKYLEATPIIAISGDKLRISYNVSKTVDTQTIVFPKPGYLFKMRIKVGEYYLTNNGSDFKWVQQLAIVTNFVDNHLGDINNFTINFDMPEIPIDGDLIIQLFGFQKVVQVSGRSGTTTGGRPGSNDTGGGEASISYIEINDYIPISIDNIKISKTKSDNKNNVDSILNISQQDAFYTTVPEDIDLLFGDFVEQVISTPSGVVSVTPSRPSRAQINGGVAESSTSIFSDLYAITYNNEYTKGWYEFGSSSAGIPIGLMLAKSIMKAYQKPFRFLNSTFYSDNFSYLDVFNAELPNNESFALRTFALLSGNYNIFSNELSNANYVEIFEKPAKTTDVSVPSYPGDNPGPIIQNPNPDEPTGLKIFTNQFTQEFQ